MHIPGMIKTPMMMIPEGASSGEAESEQSSEEGEAQVAAKPDWAPDKFWDAKTGMLRSEDMAKSYKELESWKFSKNEAKLAEAHKQIEEKAAASKLESADAYELPEIEGVEFSDDDPLLGVFRNIAHETGLTQEQFNDGISKYIDTMAENAPKYDDEMKKLGENAQMRVEAAGMFTGKNFTPETASMINSITSTAEGVVAIEEIMNLVGGPNPGPSGEGSGAGAIKTRDELRTMMADPKYHSEYQRDPAWVKEVEDGFKALNAR
jgi:hypothetical protein